MDEEIKNAVYIWQLGRLLKYQHEKGALRGRVTKSEGRELKQYFRLGKLPNPDQLGDAAVGILVTHRRRMEAADPGFTIAFLFSLIASSGSSRRMPLVRCCQRRQFVLVTDGAPLPR